MAFPTKCMTQMCDQLLQCKFSTIMEIDNEISLTLIMVDFIGVRFAVGGKINPA